MVRQTEAKVTCEVRPRTGRGKHPHRKGAVLVLFAVLLTAFIGILAFALDIGFMMNSRTELQRAADAGALAGAGVLVDGVEAADAAARDYVVGNVNGVDIVRDDIEIEFGQWNEDTRTFTPGEKNILAIRVRAVQEDRPMFFGRVLGRDSFDMRAEAIAVFQPRDIMVVLDLSASMNDDSELKSISKLGRTAVEGNLLQIYQELGSPKFGSMTWTPKKYTGKDKDIKKALGLDKVSYPYDGGSWDEYINYVQGDNTVDNAGYEDEFGYLTWIQYLLAYRPSHDDTEDLWKTSEQPITAVKNAVTLLLAYIQEVETDDRVGLAVYTSTNGQALLEVPLTANMQLVEDTARQRQAGHYHGNTNIGAGVKVAREELEKNGRKGAKKMMVMLTDGIANLPSGNANGMIKSEAGKCAALDFPVVAISLGAGADTSQMETLAEDTSGVHFNIPGGGSVAEYEEDLKDVFRQIASDRPLRLVD